jgi:hypothetical protein
MYGFRFHVSTSSSHASLLQLYTKAFEASTPSTSIELKRTILANRAQTYIFYGNIHKDSNSSSHLRIKFITR